MSLRLEAPMAMRTANSCSRETARASRHTVLVALAANALVALTKLAGGALSGSAALFAEAAHSIADTTNQAFLLASISLAERAKVPLGTMKSWIRRGLLQLRACLET